MKISELLNESATQELTLYHGGAIRVDKFTDTSVLGYRGLIYGWGIYLTNGPKMAKGYATTRRRAQAIESEVRNWLQILGIEPDGWVMTCRIPANAKLINCDSPITSQSVIVNALKGDSLLRDEFERFESTTPKGSGYDFIQFMAKELGKQRASWDLSKGGIDGAISNQTGTAIYAIYDPSIITVIDSVQVRRGALGEFIDKFFKKQHPNSSLPADRSNKSLTTKRFPL
jgi:hypothetical protein